jgi:hypothetical protein
MVGVVSVESGEFGMRVAERQGRQSSACMRQQLVGAAALVIR